MVNTKNISRFDGIPPNSDDAPDRRIQNEPIYVSEDVLRVLGPDTVRAITRRCSRDTQGLGFEGADLAELIEQALRDGLYKHSEWCATGTPGAWAACDAYELRRREWIESCNKHMDCSYYLKFAISKQGDLILLFSCHT